MCPDPEIDVFGQEWSELLYSQFAGPNGAEIVTEAVNAGRKSVGVTPFDGLKSPLRRFNII